MKLHSFLLAIWFFTPVFAFSGISGKYRVYGSQPSGSYKSTLVIERDGSLYHATWTNEDGTTETGTGVRKGDALSFVFQKNSTGAYGTQMYKISKNEIKGPWAWYGSTWTSVERLRRIK